ncbi:MAG: GH92 family glycosyl hydrolase [Prevotella sp.]|nr:GH92 family glycosyl hydrolase [Prevotella sp.]
MNIKRIIVSLIAIIGLCSSSVAANSQKEDLTKYVNQWIGTGGHGHVFLGANVPFGLVQLGPTQYTHGWDWCSGYHISDSLIIGFGHMHLSGTGIGDLGDIALLPVGYVNQKDVRFDHQNEVVRPGYYSVKLNNPNVFVELTATKRVGMHRYTFGGDTESGLIALNLRQGIGWDNVKESRITQESPNTVTGYRRSHGWARDQIIYFVAEFSSPVTVQEQQGDTVTVFRIDDVSSPLLVKVALSPVSVENAKLNMKAELPDWHFNNTVATARQAWNDELSKIKVSTDDITKKRIFYTAMYHTMIAPSVFSDVNGDYRGADYKNHHGDFTNYTTFSLWDTYRAAHPLMTLIHPEKQRDIAETFINIYIQQGKLPVWHLMGNETDCMVGNPGIPVMADLVLKGFVSDKETAFEALRSSALCDDRGLNLLKEYGYLPFDKDSTYETVAKGLEYALADDGVAKVARLLGKQKDYKYFLNRSKSYKIYFDKKSGFMRGVGSDGKFREPFDSFNAVHRQDDYTEGNAWQYAWLVPHDVHGLVNLFGSEQRFIAKFDSLFVVTGNLGAEASPDISGLIGQYAHGNEPSHHILYMYNYVGQPYKAAPLLRKTMKELYFDDYDGLSGNEDVGQMSAWYILSSVGLYQVEPSGGKYIIGSPIFNEAAINVGNGKTFTVKAVNNSDKNIYIQSAKLNGKPYTKSYIMFNDIQKGGVLELTMGSTPSSWGTKKSDRP